MLHREEYDCVVVGGPPAVYSFDKLHPNKNNMVTINGTSQPKKLGCYSWCREIIWEKTSQGESCYVSKPITKYRIIAKYDGLDFDHHIVTGLVIKRLWTLVQTEDGSVYSLGREIAKEKIKCRIV